LLGKNLHFLGVRVLEDRVTGTCALLAGTLPAALHKADQEEFDAAYKRIAAGAEFLCYASSRGEENGCRVIRQL
jgi:hypothetical protein